MSTQTAGRNNISSLSGKRAKNFLMRLRSNPFISVVFCDQKVHMYHTMDITLGHVGQLRKMLDDIESELKES